MPAWERADVRFNRKYRATDNGCWLWIAGAMPAGYGRFWTGEEDVLAHRFSYELFVGPIPVGLVVDHLCRTPACVNPAHLEAVTQRENVLRGAIPKLHGTGFTAGNAQKTHCPLGHPYDELNTRRTRDGKRRQCRACEVVRRERNRQARSVA